MSASMSGSIDNTVATTCTSVAGKTHPGTSGRESGPVRLKAAKVRRLLFGRQPFRA